MPAMSEHLLPTTALQHWVEQLWLAAGCSADEAEERAIEQIQKLGQELLTDWAQGAQEQSLRAAQQQHPQGSKHVKKK